ncbi:unnamed protein product [Macrosiphum euphorbiae]|uniref:Uncharacterized protein n=2 Tax=Macrosiphum euphorbiae TaxID=13131 RepID=A0AAV0W460_9HEMI|nr:unnamed protein product [Macrosiphum euphorbiae]
MYMMNATESVVFIPSSNLEPYLETWANVKDDNVYYNLITYNDEYKLSLSNTDLDISDKKLTNAIYKSFIDNQLSEEIITVFPNRYIILTENGTRVFSFKYINNINVVSKNCDKFQIQYQSTRIEGLICKVKYMAGIRYKVICGKIGLEFMPINEVGELEAEIQCIT